MPVRSALVERTSRLLMLIKLPHPQPASVLQAFTGKLSSIAVYFCDPHSPWQRGSSENMNGLVRQYLPKGTDLSGYTQQQLDEIADQINARPRKGLGVRCPLAIYR